MPWLSDRSVIRAILETDRPWAVYALGDLSPQLFKQCSWLCGTNGAPALVLLCRAFATPVLFTLGEASALQAMLNEIGHPRQMYLHVRPEIVPLVKARYDVTQEKPMWRMVLEPTDARLKSTENVARLGVSDLAALQRLYGDGDATGEAPDFFAPSMLDEGMFFGIWDGQDLIAAAGTHLVAPAEGVAAIGNVYTRRDRRGQGLASLVTSAVTQELMHLKLRTIALNVEQRNSAAIRVYERLGFVRYCAFHEGLATLRLSVAGKFGRTP